jgi:hypothetical protein
MDFLSWHYSDLTRCAITLHGSGGSMEMPKAHADPQYAAWLHRLKMACDTFINKDAQLLYD